MPFFLSLSLSEILGGYYSQPFGMLTTSVIFIIVYFGQFSIDKYAEKMNISRVIDLTSGDAGRCAK